MLYAQVGLRSILVFIQVMVQYMSPFSASTSVLLKFANLTFLENRVTMLLPAKHGAESQYFGLQWRIHFFFAKTYTD